MKHSCVMLWGKSKIAQIWTISEELRGTYPLLGLDLGTIIGSTIPTIAQNKVTITMGIADAPML